MSDRRKAPNDAPSTLKDPDYHRKLAAKVRADQERYEALCGPVLVRKIEPAESDNG